MVQFSRDPSTDLAEPVKPHRHKTVKRTVEPSSKSAGRTGAQAKVDQTVVRTHQSTTSTSDQLDSCQPIRPFRENFIRTPIVLCEKERQTLGGVS